MHRPISVRSKHPAEPMIPDVLTATGTNSKFAPIWAYFRIFESLAAHDAEPGFRMVVRRLLTVNKSVQFTMYCFQSMSTHMFM